MKKERKEKKVNYTIRRIILVVVIMLLFYGVCALIEITSKYFHPLAVGFMFTITMLIIGIKGVK